MRPFLAAKDFIDRKPRWCFWLVDASPADLKKCPRLMKRIANIRDFRLKSTKRATQQLADSPTLFGEMRPCTSEYIAIPKVSSENRRYIPIDYLAPDIIADDKLFQMPNASLYHFGVLTSSVHMAWMRAVCGRLEMRYSYSNTIVYNNFPWCTPMEAQKAAIEQSAKAVLDARPLPRLKPCRPLRRNGNARPPQSPPRQRQSRPARLWLPARHHRKPMRSRTVRAV